MSAHKGITSLEGPFKGGKDRQISQGACCPGWHPLQRGPAFTPLSKLQSKPWAEELGEEVGDQREFGEALWDGSGTPRWGLRKVNLQAERERRPEGHGVCLP